MNINVDKAFHVVFIVRELMCKMNIYYDRLSGDHTFLMCVNEVS